MLCSLATEDTVRISHSVLLQSAWNNWEKEIACNPLSVFKKACGDIKRVVSFLDVFSNQTKEKNTLHFSVPKPFRIHPSNPYQPANARHVARVMTSENCLVARLSPWFCKHSASKAFCMIRLTKVVLQVHWLPIVNSSSIMAEQACGIPSTNGSVCSVQGATIRGILGGTTHLHHCWEWDLWGRAHLPQEMQKERWLCPLLPRQLCLHWLN